MFHTGILVKKNVIVLHILLKLVYFFGYRWYSQINNTLFVLFLLDIANTRQLVQYRYII